MVTRYVIEGDPGNTAIWERYIPYAYQSPDWQAYLSFKVPSTDSLTKRIRFLSLAQLVRQAPVGAFAECGCFEGHSTHVIATIMKECGRENPLYVFDSFAGLSAASPQDITQDPASTRLAERLRDGGAKGMFAADLEMVKANLAEHKNVRLFPGWIPERFHEVAHETFGFVHIDVDLYAPTRDSLEFFYPRLAKGGIIQIDDYNFLDWPGSNAATNEFMARNPPALFIQLPLGGAFLVK